jgi:hypothetical protein
VVAAVSADDDMRDRHGLPPRAEGPEQHPLNLAPIRAVIHVYTGGGHPQRRADRDEALAHYAARTIPALCDEIVRLRAIIADAPVIPAVDAP